ncbi:hypothetical protein [Actinophytocola sp.]|uniref:hypothetical protein n=1 Tax=Actinophytocola sp. TaxID=1872138 RepID=UPI002D3F5CE1|nr:hypothetical protein [Actinophytocola sp.]HYQ66026.1 hypothetical protein [Actinophytocola sp.]
MTTPEAESFAELIADCAAIPAELRASEQNLPGPRAATPWEVDDATFAQVSSLEEYV